MLSLIFNLKIPRKFYVRGRSNNLVAGRVPFRHLWFLQFRKFWPDGMIISILFSSFPTLFSDFLLLFVDYKSTDPDFPMWWNAVFKNDLRNSNAENVPSRNRLIWPSPYINSYYISISKIGTILHHISSCYILFSKTCRTKYIATNMICQAQVA